MSETAPAAPERLRWAYHLIIGAAIGLVAPFTGLAWPVAMLLGVVIGSANAERERGERPTGATQAVRVLAVTGGVLAMLLLGAIVGGLIAFLVVALTAFSERVAARSAPVDRTMARLLIAIVAVAVWVALALVLNLKVDLKFGV